MQSLVILLVVSFIDIDHGPRGQPAGMFVRRAAESAHCH